MANKLKFTAKENKVIDKALTQLSSILLQKMDEGFSSPSIKGSMTVTNENRIVVFTLTAMNI
jgi:hypothetical protein